MSELELALDAFHFLRPAWLALAAIVAAVWAVARLRRRAGIAAPLGLAPHLADALTVGRGRGGGVRSGDGIAVALALSAIAAAGPTWSRIPDPLVAPTAPLAIALSAAESMTETDIAPSRLERAKQKLRDLTRARAGARTALIAWSGTAHGVVPLTEDPTVLEPFIEGLSPDVMPEPGRNATAALARAKEALARDPMPGAILFVLDALDPADLPTFAEHAADEGAPVVFLVVGGEETAAETRSLLGRVPRSVSIAVTPDAADVQAIERRLASAYRQALLADERQAWDDRGWMLAGPAALLVLVGFRRGFTARIAVLLSIGIAVAAPGPAWASDDTGSDGLLDHAAQTVVAWLFTPDQRGRFAFENGRYEDAAALFEEPMWRGYALAFLGRYIEAAAAYARVDTADAAFARGTVLVKGREYRDAVDAFETALARNPDHATAAHNLEVTREIIDYLERVRTESDTGGKLGADEIVFDRESKGGVRQVMGGGDRIKLESAEQWMRTVDTRMADFLSLRFALEASEDAP